jgi:hypothetical protein
VDLASGHLCKKFSSADVLPANTVNAKMQSAMPAKFFDKSRALSLTAVTNILISSYFLQY